MKKFLWIFISVSLPIIFFLFFMMNNNEKEKNNDQNLENSTNEEESILTAEQFIQKVLLYAKDGKVFHAPFIAGKTTWEEVQDTLGAPEKMEHTTVGDYANFSTKDLSVGIDHHLVFDIRSYHDGLANIRLNDIKKQLGEPEKITYYEDETTSEMILYYSLNDEYVIKWILPKATEQLKDPKVHHISVITKDNPGKYANLVNQMTLVEKIGQLFFIGISVDTLDDEAKRLITEQKVGGIIFFKDNLTSTSQIYALLNEINHVNSRHNRYPLFLGIDQEGGKVNRLPSEIAKIPTPLTIGSYENELFAYEYGTLLGKQLTTFGFNLNFAPVLDVNSNPNNPVIGDRSFSNHPEIVAKLGIQAMIGIQDENIIPVIKHFPGHGDTSVDSHLDLPIIRKSLHELEQLELIPFKRAISEGADVVMVAHILLPQLDDQFPASMSEKIITELLRNQLGFQGVVITDDLTMQAITKHYSIPEATIQSIQAGNDLILIAHDYDKIFASIERLKRAVESGEISEERINRSVMRILRLKEKYQLKSQPIENGNIQELNQSIIKILSKYNK